MNIPSVYQIKRIRPVPNKKTTYAGYKKTEILSKLQKAIMKKDIDNALSFAVELHISGYLDDVWKKITQIMGKYIYVLYPKLCIYINREYQLFREKLRAIPDSYNNQEVRNHLVEWITVLCVCTKQKILSMPKITSDDFMPSSIQQKICATENMVHFLPSDPKYIRMPINEFVFHLYKNDHSHTTKEQCLYWLKFLFTIEKKRKKQKKEIICAERPHSTIDPKYYSDYTWILWVYIRHHVDVHSTNHPLHSIIKSLFSLYCSNYTKGTRNSKRPLLLYAACLVLDTHPRINFQSHTIIPISAYNIIIRSQMYVNELYRSVAEDAVKQIHDIQLRKQLVKRKKIRVHHEPDAHFNEFLKEKLYNI